MKFIISIILLNSALAWSISPDANYYFEARQELKEEASRDPSAEGKVKEEKDTTIIQETAHKKAEHRGAKNEK